MVGPAQQIDVLTVEKKLSELSTAELVELPGLRREQMNKRSCCFAAI
jgi:hypothetical protein